MDSTEHRDDQTSANPVRETPAAHFQEAYALLRDLFLVHVSTRGPLHHLAQCRNGVLDYALDVVGDQSPAGRLSTSGWEAGSMASFDQMVAMTVTQLDRRLADAVTGGLIRVVVECDDGAVVCDSIVPGVLVIGAVAVDGTVGRARDGAVAADRGVAHIAAEVRHLLRLGPLNFGSYENGPPPPEPPPTAQPKMYASGETGDVFFARCAAVLDTRDVHYVAFYREGELQFAADLFDDTGIEQYFAFTTRPQRRRFYETLCNDSEAIVADLSRAVWPLVDEPPNRVVLDVEQGAIYFFQLTEIDYLVGVTLDQTQVANSDRKLHDLATAIRPEVLG